MMHARLATCGNREDVRQAHPYTIRRNGKTILWGAHNGQIWDAEDSAAYNGREYTVDSRELFELLADNDLAAIQRLNGYGVITWMTPHSPTVKLSRLSDHSEIVVARLAEGGIAWASTHAILANACEDVGLEISGLFDLDEIGRVYEIYGKGVIATKRDGIRFAEDLFSSPPMHFDVDEDWTEDDRKAFTRWLEQG